MSEGANRIFLRENPLVEKELLKRLKRGDTTIELAEYLKTTKWPGSTAPATVSAFIQNTYPKENMQVLLDAGYTESQIKKMTPAKRTGLKDSIRTYRKILIPHLKKYDGTIESLVVEGVRDNKDLDYQLKKFRKETDPKVLKLLEKELGNPEFRTKIAQNQLNKLVESGGTDAIRIERSLTSQLLKQKPIKEAWAAGEKWISDNAPIYDDPAKMQKDFIKKFGKDHPLIEGIKTKYNPLSKGFSAAFTKDVLGSPKAMKLTKQNLRNIFNAAIYNFNDDVRDNILAELKTFAQKAAPTRYEARDRLQTPLLKKFNLNNKIHGPISRLILEDLGKDIYRNIQNNRAPRMDTIRHLQYLQTKVDPAYKKMFGETIKSLQFAQQKLWPEAKKQFKIAENITFEHKIPQSLIDRGYADPVEYIKVVPTQRGFNEVKFRTFDKPLTNYITKYENAAPEDKAKWLTKMNNLKNKFNKKFGNYLGDVRIEEADGNLKLRSLGQAVTQETDLKSSLQAALKQEKGIVPRNFLESIRADAVAGGQICSLVRTKKANGGTISCVDAVEEAIQKEPEKLAEKASRLEKFKNSATGFLNFVKKGGKLGALAAAGAAGAGLVKTFMNDDPTTYLSNEDQQKNMLIDMVTGPMVDQPDSTPEILDWQLPVLGATTAAGTAVTAPSTIEAARSARFGKKPSGYTKTALKTLGRGLAASGTPLGLAALEPLHIAGQVQAGDSLGEIATNPWNYAGLAFADNLSKFATKGLGPGISKAMRLGISPAALKVGSRFLGMPGLALSLGISGYETYDDWKKKRGWFSEE